MYVIDQNNEGKMYYIYTDHLGSPNLITDAQCNVVQELSYDACFVKLGFWEYNEPKPIVEPIPTLREGNRRDPATWQPFTSTPTEPFIDRGFTFHSLPREERNGEHLYPFTLINMNGRAYDPLVGRFLSADPYIQAPDNTQNLNRYSYCLNNPLRYTDPQGEFLIEAMIIGGLANWLMSGAQLNSEGLLSFTVGAFSGFAGAGIGASAANAVTIGGFAGGFQVGAAGGAAGGFTGGAGYAWTHGASLGDGLLAGLTGAGIGAALGGLTGGISKGIADHKLGLDFWDGSGDMMFKPIQGRIYSPEEVREAFNLAPRYNETVGQQLEEAARLMMKDEFGIEIGDLGLTDITSKISLDKYGKPLYGYDNINGNFVSAKGEAISGYYNPSSRSIHLSSSTTSNITKFRAVAGHELIHTYHHFKLGSSLDRRISEIIAYRYSFNVSYGDGFYDNASFYLFKGIENGSWGGYPIEYEIPAPFRFN